MKCAYCDQDLTCEGCGTDYVPPTPEAYESIQACEEAVLCPVCEAVLICRWCKSAYDGRTDEADGEEADSL